MANQCTMLRHVDPCRAPSSNFRPIILADVLDPFPQPHLEASKVGASGDSSTTTVAIRRPFLKYTPVFMKSLRFTAACTSRPDGLPAVPGITPGMRCDSPPPPLLPPPMGPPMPMLVLFKAPPPAERMFHMYAHAVPVPYMRTFGTNHLYKQHQYGQLPYHPFH